MGKYLDGDKYKIKDIGLMMAFGGFQVGKQIPLDIIQFIESGVSHEVDSEVYKDEEGYVIFGHLLGTREPTISAIVFKKNDNGDFIRGTRADDIYKRAVMYKDLVFNT